MQIQLSIILDFDKAGCHLQNPSAIWSFSNWIKYGYPINIGSFNILAPERKKRCTLSRGDHLYTEYKGALKGRWSCDKSGKSGNTMRSAVQSPTQVNSTKAHDHSAERYTMYNSMKSAITKCKVLCSSGDTLPAAMGIIAMWRGEEESGVKAWAKHRQTSLGPTSSQTPICSRRQPSANFLHIQQTQLSTRDKCWTAAPNGELVCQTSHCVPKESRRVL